MPVNDFSRRSFLKGALALGALTPMSALLSACGSTGNEPIGDLKSTGSNAESAPPGPASPSASGSVLMAYYSATGNTKSVAETIADQLNAATFELAPKQPYSRDDLNYSNDDSRVSREHEDANRHTELETVTPEGFDTYGTIFVGYPIWWQEAAWPIDDFIKGNDFSGKTVIPFCTSASSPLGDSGELLAQMAGAGNWQEGMRFSSAASKNDIEDWLSGLSL